MEVTILQCCVVIEWKNEAKEVTKKVRYPRAFTKLLRNEFRELFLEVDADAGKSKQRFQAAGANIHKKFAAEGKATVDFTRDGVSVMLSNAPAAQLVSFLKTLFVKMCSKKQSPKVPIRQQLLSGKDRILEEISPVNAKDINRLRSEAAAKEKKMTPNQLKKRRLIETQATKSENKKQCLMSLVQSSKLTEEQQEVLNAATSKQNIFFTGSAGTGKSYLLRCIINMLPPDETVATASTGSAACLIGGITLHSFIGIGGGDVTLERGVELASRPAVAQNWRRCKYLIIDEISMIDAEFFEKIEYIARKVRKSEQPFGGIKLILCGDFLQLPPVKKNGAQAKFSFQSKAWAKCQLKCFNLKRVHRQTDPVFVAILNAVRVGRITEQVSEALKATSRNLLERDGIVPTQLCCKTLEAKSINENQLKRLIGKEYSYEATDVGHEKMLDDHTPVSKRLTLKVGAQVMLVKNISVAAGLVNGARGIVATFEASGLPIVHFVCGVERVVDHEKWVVKGVGGGVSTRKQLPLKLAWAFSIHKSQGLTLDCVEMSLAGCFEAGQAYVALSRARSLQSLRVRDFNPNQVWANGDVIRYYRMLDFGNAVTKKYPLGKVV